VLRNAAWAVCVGYLGQPLEELLDRDRHGETGGPDADAGPATIADHGHTGFGHAFHEVASEVAVASGPDPLLVGVVEGGPPLVGELQGVTHAEPPSG
jgi:hypothetical protein